MSSNETPPPPPPEEITPPQVVVSRRECGQIRVYGVSLLSKWYYNKKPTAAIEVSLHICYSSFTNFSVYVLLAE